VLEETVSRFVHLSIEVLDIYSVQDVELAEAVRRWILSAEPRFESREA
jgi:hypothetical protein